MHNRLPSAGLESRTQDTTAGSEIEKKIEELSLRCDDAAAPAEFMMHCACAKHLFLLLRLRSSRMLKSRHLLLWPLETKIDFRFSERRRTKTSAIGAVAAVVDRTRRSSSVTGRRRRSVGRRGESDPATECVRIVRCLFSHLILSFNIKELSVPIDAGYFTLQTTGQRERRSDSANSLFSSSSVVLFRRVDIAE